MKYFSLLSSLLVALCCLGFVQEGAAGTSEHVKQRMIQDLEFIKHTFETQYAPALWKQQHLEWSLETEFEKVKQEIQEADTITVKQFQQKVRRFLNSTQDYHVTVGFISTESAKLPFQVRSAEGKYFIVGVDNRYLSPASYQIAAGDELIAFDGKPVEEEIVKLIAANNRNHNSLTDHAIAEMNLTYRKGHQGDDVPRGPVLITIRSAQTDQVRSYQLMWDYKPEKVLAPGELCWVPPFKIDFFDNFFKKKEISHPLKKQLLSPLYAVYQAPSLFSDELEEESGDEEPNFLGARKSYIPYLGPVIWSSGEQNPFHAYIYENEKGQHIGYIRIPHYVSMDTDRPLAFAEILRLFQEHTEALVIDQIDNPGGSALYLYVLASMLTDQPLKTPRHRLSLAQEDILDAVETLKALDKVKSDTEVRKIYGESPYPFSYQMVQFFKEHYRFLLEEWSKGHLLTKPTFIMGVDYINPSSLCRYTKPILMLVNQLDFSGGDFLPAILQDNKRAKIFGTKTAGAGGYIVASQFKNLHGIAYFTYTGSIAERVDQQPIENLGVKPDIEYNLTAEDMKGARYVSYRAAINKAVEDLITGQLPSEVVEPVEAVPAVSSSLEDID